MRSKSYLCSSFHPRRALPPRAPLRFCHIAPLPLTPRKTATTPQAEACGVTSAYPRSIASEAGLAPSGSPAAPSHNSAATDSLQNSDNPAGQSLRGCLSMTLQTQRSVFLVETLESCAVVRSLRQLCLLLGRQLLDLRDAPDERREHNNDQCIVAVIAIDLGDDG